MQNIFRSGLFKNHVAIVTGGGSGIGVAIAESLGQLGAKVAICGRNVERLENGADRLRKKGIEVFHMPCDIRDKGQVESFIDSVKSSLGPATILVNNAGGQFSSKAEDISKNGFESVVNNNLNGTFTMTQYVASQHMIPAKKGRIINITANIKRGFPGMAHTGAARAGVESLTKTLAIEWAEHNIQVNAVAPGVILSSGTERYPRDLLEKQRINTPAKRFGTVQEVSMLVTYLASDVASFVTGEVLYIDGGANLWGRAWDIPEHGNSRAPAEIEEV